MSTQPPSSQTEVNNTCFRNVENTAVAAQLTNLFPTVGKRSFAGKSCNTKSVKGKKPLPKKAKKDVVHKDVVLLPSPDTKSVSTHQTRCRLENNGFVVHAFPVDKSLQEEDLRAQIREMFPPLAETDFEFVKSCYGQIITPKLATGVHFSASRVLGLAGQGSIYIRPECDISATLCSDTDSPPLVQMQVVQTQAQVHFLNKLKFLMMAHLEELQIRHTFQLLAHLAVQQIRKGWIN